jgi:hypothetical protein
MVLADESTLPSAVAVSPHPDLAFDPTSGEVVDAFDGEMTIADNEPRGTAVTLELPAVR